MKMIRFPLLLSVLFALASLASPPRAAGAAQYHIAQNHPQASDSGPGTSERPWKTLGKATQAVKAGDTVLLHAGIYRETGIVKASGTKDRPIRIQAATGERVVITGADLLTKWQQVEADQPVYRSEWPHRFITWNETMTHPSDRHHEVIGRAEQVFVNGYLMRQVLNRNQLAPGTFFVDVNAKQLYVRGSGNEDLNRAFVEASARPVIFRTEGAHIHLRGIRFRYAANRAQEGAVQIAGNHNVMEDCVVEGTNTIGATFLGEGIVVRRSIFRDHGQLGFSAYRAHDLLFTESLVENNNVKNFSRGWEAGGNKIVLCRGVTLDRSRFERNRGVGVWFDIGNEKSTVRNCLIRNNEDAGIFYEISYSLHAHDNVIVGNGFAVTQGAWGAQAGIALSSSPDCLIERNLLIGNREGFNFREQGRTTPKIESGKEEKEEAVWNHDEIIRSNILAYNQDAQVWGWFDVNDERHWPRMMQGDAGRAKGEGREDKPANLAADYAAKDEKGQPVGLSLEKLDIRFRDNLYYAAPGQGMIHWGVTWKRHVRYPSPAAFAKELKIASGGRILQPGFADLLTLDLRVPPERLKAMRQQYPRGKVPGVQLGALPEGMSSVGKKTAG